MSYQPRDDCAGPICSYGQSRLCKDCQSIFTGELVCYSAAYSSPNLKTIEENYVSFGSTAQSVATLGERDCHLCYMQSRSLRQSGAATDRLFVIRYTIEWPSSDSSALILNFAYESEYRKQHERSAVFSARFFLDPLQDPTKSSPLGSEARVPFSTSENSWETHQQHEGPPFAHKRCRIGSVERADCERLESCTTCSTLPSAHMSRTDSALTWAACRMWIQTCLEHHDQSGSITFGELPTRLVDVSDADTNHVKLVRGMDLPPEAEYTTLSYCWV